MNEMQIRHATDDDREAIHAMGARFYAATHYADLAPYCAGSVDVLIDMMLDGVLLVAEAPEGLVGMVGLVVGPFPFNHSIAQAHEVMWWVDPFWQGQGAGRALLAAIEPAARERGARAIIMMHLANSPPQAAALYEKLGYRRTEAQFTKEL